MRQVVERVICDISGEVGYTDQNSLSLTTLNFSWLGKDYELDACGRCAQRVGGMTVHDLIEKARLAGRPSKPKSKPKAGRAKGATPVKHTGDAPDEEPAEDGTVTCGACGNVSPTHRGYRMHWTRQRKEEQRLKAVG